MQAVDDTVEVGSPIDSHSTKFLELLPIFDKLDFDASFRFSDSSIDDIDVSDNDSLPEGYDDDIEGISDGITPDEIPSQPITVAPKALKVLGETDDIPSFSGGMAPKAMKVLGVASPRFSFPSLPKKRLSLVNDHSRSRDSKLNLSRARQLLFRQNSSLSSVTGDELMPAQSRTDSSAATSFFSSSERSSKTSDPGSPEDALGLRAQLDYSSVLRVRKLVDSLEQEVAQADLNKPLPLAPKKQHNILQPTNQGTPNECSSDTDLLDAKYGSAGQVLYHSLTTTQEQQIQSSTDIPKLSIPLPRIANPRKHVSQMMYNSLSNVRGENGQGREIEGVALKILLSIDNLDDICSIAMVNKSFYNAYRRHETLIVSRTVLVSSPAAWELRQSLNNHMRPSPFRMKSVRRDITSIQALEAFIVMRCRSVCRPDTIQALLGGDIFRKFQLENALWRVWTFCKLFGKGSGVEEDFSKQVSWLNGGQCKSQIDQQSFFGVGNGAGVNMQELEDMSEIWRCMENLLAGFRGREEDAKRTGVFDKCTPTNSSSETDSLEAWIHDMLSLGPKAVLTLSSCDFAHAKVLGLTNWTPPTGGQNRQNFFKAAVEEAYRERLVADAQRLANEFKSSNYVSSHQRSASDSAVTSPALVPHRLRPPIKEQGLKVDTSRPSTQEGTKPNKEHHEPNMAIQQNSDPLSPSAIPSASAATNPMAFSSISLARNASTKLGSSLFPTHPALQSPQVAIISPPPPVPQTLHNPEVVDPTDKAIHKLVHEMGYSESEAKRALALSDTGVGIDVQKAIEILSAKQAPAEKEVVDMSSHALMKGSPRNLSRQSTQRTQDYCEGTCPSKTVIIAEPKRERVQGLGFVKRTMSVRKSIRKIGGPLSTIIDDEGVKSQSDSALLTGRAAASEFQSAVRTQSFRENGGGIRNYMSGALNTGFALPPAATRSTNDLLQAPNRLATLDEMPSPSSVYSDTEAYAWPTESNGNGLWGALAAAAPSATPQSNYDNNSSAGGSVSTRDDSSLQLSPGGSPRVTLTRVGTGKTSHGKPWRFASVRKNAASTRPKKEEIIGYAY